MFIDSDPWLIIKTNKINWIAVYDLVDKSYTGKKLFECLSHLVKYLREEIYCKETKI